MLSDAISLTRQRCNHLADWRCSGLLRAGGGGRDFPWLQVHDPQRGKKEKIEPKGPPSCSIYCLHVLIPGTLKKIEVTAMGLRPSMILAL